MQPQPLSKVGHLYYVMNQLVAVPLALYGAWDEYDNRDPRDVRAWEQFDGLVMALAAELAEVPFELEPHAEFDFETFYEQEAEFYNDNGYDHELFMLDAAALGVDENVLKVWTYAYVIAYTLEAYFELLRSRIIQNSAYATAYDQYKAQYEDSMERMLAALRADLETHNPLPPNAQKHVSELARRWATNWRETVLAIPQVTLS